MKTKWILLLAAGLLALWAGETLVNRGKESPIPKKKAPVAVTNPDRQRPPVAPPRRGIPNPEPDPVVDEAFVDEDTTEARILPDPVYDDQNQRMEALQDRFDTEHADRRWAARAEEEIRRNLAASSPDSEASRTFVRALECRGTTCRLEVELAAAEDSEPAQLVASQLRFWDGPGELQAYPEENGYQVVVFLGRSSESLQL